MRFLNLTGQGLVALLLFVFTSCDKLLPPSGSGSGKLVPVRIGAINIAGGAQNKTVTRAGGSEQKRIVGEPVVDLGGGLLAKITVEEEVEALRADGEVKTLDKDVTFRVIAVDADDNKVASYGDYTVGADKTITMKEGTSLTVTEGHSYYFVCVSYNNATLPPAPALNATLGNVSVTADSNDLLWEKPDDEVSVSDEELAPLSFNMGHKFVRVKLVINAGSGNVITNVSSSITFGPAAIARNFHLRTGALSGSATDNLSFSWPTLNLEEVTGNPVRFASRTSPATGYTLTLPEGAVTLSDGSQSKAATCEFPVGTFVAGSSYTIRITPHDPPAPTMQTFSAADCNAMAINEIVTRVDSRNGQEYKIIKLKMSADGSLARCWMQQNLKIADVTITSADSDFEGADFTIQPVSSTNTISYQPAAPYSDGAEPANFGYKYNWATAIAFSADRYEESGEVGDTGPLTEAQYSICPKGWRLPVGGTDIDKNEFSLVDIHAFGGTGANRNYSGQVFLSTYWCNKTLFAAIFPQPSTYTVYSTTFWSSLVNTGYNGGAYVYGLYLYFSKNNSGTSRIDPMNGTNLGKIHYSPIRCVRRD